LSRTGGVGYEQQIISGHIAAGIPRRKFIPIVRSGQFEPGPDCAIPPHFGGILAIDIRPAQDEEKAFETVLRAIFNVPVYAAPPLGPRPSFVQPSSAEPVELLRLADYEVEGWRLLSGVIRNQLSPDTFYLPSEIERRAVVKGDLVKLMFEFLGEDEEGEPEPLGERMWVKVTGKSGPYFKGELRNTASIFWGDRNEDGTYKTIEDAPLKWGDEVVFLPEHIIDIDDEERSDDGVEKTSKKTRKKKR
jgi:hypothetical protein